jgi:hypothetical protein
MPDHREIRDPQAPRPKGVPVQKRQSVHARQ